MERASWSNLPAGTEGPDWDAEVGGGVGLHCDVNAVMGRRRGPSEGEGALQTAVEMNAEIVS